MGCWRSPLATELFSPIVDPSGLRSEFPVLAELAYLNAGTDGPLPRRAVEAARAELDRELADGRAMAHFERRGELGKALRGAYARASARGPCRRRAHDQHDRRDGPGCDGDGSAARR